MKSIMQRLHTFPFLVFLSLLVLFPTLGLAGNVDLEKEVQNSLAQTLKLVKKIESRLASGKPVTGEVASLKQRVSALSQNHVALQERFRGRGDAVNVHGLKIWQRHHAVFSRYEEAMEQILNMVDSLPDDGAITIQDIETLHNLLNSVLPKKKQPILGSLPYRNLNYSVVAAPITSPIIPAYKGGDKVVVEADLAGSPEAPISRPIAELAESLNWNPVEIYQWVKDNIETEWYWGVMKGAEQTLLQKSGNDADQASLLVALLRSSGFPSRYVRGVIGFFPDMTRAHDLIGIDDNQELAAFFQKAGIPFTLGTVGGKLVINIEHIWVESFIPTANYRGAVIDEHGKAWLAFDTSIKAAVNYTTPPDTLSAFSFGDLATNYLANSQPENFTQFSQTAITEYLASQAPDTVYADLLSASTTEPELLELLPASLQFNQFVITGEYTSLPDELIHQAHFTAQSEAGDVFFEATLPVFELSNQSIALIYEPETVEDQEVINSYGGLTNTPAYLIHLRPVLTVNGERTLVGQGGLAAGEDFSLKIELVSPHGPEVVENNVTCGNLVVLGLVGQQVVMPKELVDTRKNAERLLFEQALNYIDAWNKAEEEQASLLHLQLSRPIPSLITMGGVLDVTYLFDTPHSYTWKGLFIDADLRAAETASGLTLHDGTETGTMFMKLASLAGSAEEHKVFENGFGVDAVSTAKLMGLAAENGLDIITIDSSNITTLLPTLNLADNIHEDIQNSINQGLTVRIPSAQLSRNSWTGIGYIKENQLSGETGYMLSGLLAGGMTTPAPGDWSDYFTRDVLASPFTEPPNTNPDAVVSLKVIRATDAGAMCTYNGKFEIGSINAVFNIGAASNGGNAGSLILRAKQPSTLLAQPQGLRFSSLAGGETEVVVDPASGIVAQLVGPAALADMRVVSPFGYQIRLYPIAAKGAMVDGRYEIDPASAPITTWTIENPAKSETDFSTLRITEDRGKTYVTEYTWDDTSHAWTLSQGNGQQIETKVETTNLDGDRVVTRTITNDKGEVGSKTVTTYHTFPWGEEIISQVVDPDGAALTTSKSYYEDITLVGSYSRERQVTNAYGSWQRTEYDELGRTIREISNWLDAPSTASISEARVVSFDYTPVDPGDLDAPRFRMSPRTTTEAIQGIVVSKSFKAYIGDGLLEDRQEISEQCSTPSCSYGASTNQRTVTTYYRSNNVDLTTMRVHPSSGKIKSVLSADGTLSSYTYETGTFTMAGTPDQWTFVPGDGWDSRQIVTQGTINSPSGIAGKTTRSIRVTNRFKQTLFNETLVYTGSGYEQINWSANTLDELGRISKVERSDGIFTETIWGCCSKDSETDSQGNTTTYQYDNLRRLISQDRQGPNGNTITTEYAYDAAGRRTGQSVNAGSLSQSTASTYDSSGRLQTSVDVSGLASNYSYSADGLINIVTQPGGATTISENYPDGQPKSVTGSGVVAQYYSYTINADGSRTTKVSSLSPNSPRWQQSTTDMLGRTIRSEQPGATGVEVSKNFYDEFGRLIRTTTSGQPDRLYIYDELGNQIASGLDLDKSGVLEEASSDRISATSSQYVKIGGDWWKESTSQIFVAMDDGTATTLASQRSRVSGLGICKPKPGQVGFWLLLFGWPGTNQRQ